MLPGDTICMFALLEQIMHTLGDTHSRADSSEQNSRIGVLVLGGVAGLINTYLSSKVLSPSGSYCACSGQQSCSLYTATLRAGELA